jgi:siroheme synthase (precorrin-2 oxidase/ferrochelatase)
MVIRLLLFTCLEATIFDHIQVKLFQLKKKKKKKKKKKRKKKRVWLSHFLSQGEKEKHKEKKDTKSK